jgi:branched-subunit amino acid transport protein
MTANYIYIAILISAAATYLSRFLGVLSAKYVNEEGKLFKFVSCISYGILSALIARIFYSSSWSFRTNINIYKNFCGSTYYCCSFSFKKECFVVLFFWNYLIWNFKFLYSLK